jgi:trans-2,3-dihydro-3-hydroxyanthranilate isomerase
MGVSAAMKLQFHTLDVFTHRKFSGNPLAVVLGADALTTGQMQAITREFNLSETAFVLKPEDPGNTARVRIFFPGGEMPFAGHPTLGTAALLAELRNKPGCTIETTITLELKAGLTPVRVSRIADRLTGMFTAPVLPFFPKVKLPGLAETAKALNLDVEDIGFDGHGLASVEAGPRFFYVPVRSRAALEKSGIREPQWSNLLHAVNRDESVSTIDAAYLYARGGDGRDTAFRARMYCPTGGIPEDPATGSATVNLAAQLLSAEKLADGLHRWQIEQGYEMGRPSDLRLEADVDSGKLMAVRIGGSAVRMMSGELEL